MLGESLLTLAALAGQMVVDAATSPASKVSLFRALTHATSRQLSASLARAYVAAS